MRATFSGNLHFCRWLLLTVGLLDADFCVQKVIWFHLFRFNLLQIVCCRYVFVYFVSSFVLGELLDVFGRCSVVHLRHGSIVLDFMAKRLYFLAVSICLPLDLVLDAHRCVRVRPVNLIVQ